MKLAGILFTLLFTSLSFAQTTFYVRKTVAKKGVEAQGQELRDALRNAFTARGWKLTGSQEAKYTFLPRLERSGESFRVFVDRIENGKAAATAEVTVGSANEFGDASASLAKEMQASITEEAPVAPTAKVETAPTRKTASIGGGLTMSTRNKWFIGIGPAISEDLLGTDVGTKTHLSFGYTIPIWEKADVIMRYDHSFNTASAGASNITLGRAGFMFYTVDRGANNSPIFEASVGYGGGNRFTDAGPTLTVGVGGQFFRTKDFTFEFAWVKTMVFSSSTVRVSSTPNVDVLRFGIYF
ncbi:MAG: hypothetical protein IT289_03480 [Oligoflexia bacterium]|nr:hypothetical protein [Oligoflexia bacterium]